MKKFSLTGLLIFIVSAELTGALSALASGSFSGLYSGVSQPPLSPPAFLFPVVWTLLYALMGASAYIIYREDDDLVNRSYALGYYVIQLAVNFTWSILFFRFELFGIAAVTAILLFALVAVMILSFRKVSRLAAVTSVPYLVWLAFASYLAIGVWYLN